MRARSRRALQRLAEWGRPRAWPRVDSAFGGKWCPGDASNPYILGHQSTATSNKIR